MKCCEVRRQLEAAFDVGADLCDQARIHLDTCSRCAGYRDQFAELDAILHAGPPVAQDPVLVARIQASIADVPARRPLDWKPAAGLAAAACLAMAAGWFADLAPSLSLANWLPWVPSAPTVPDWSELRYAFAAFPAEIVGESQAALRWLSGIWADGTARLGELLGVGGVRIWMAFVALLAVACALNGAEAANGHRTRLRGR